MGELVWSKVTVAPGVIVRVEFMLVTILPVGSITSERSPQFLTSEDWFATSVLTFTVPEAAERFGVVTKVPYQVTWRGPAATSQTLR